MAYEKEKEQFDRDGFAVVRGFFAGDELRELQANLDRYISEIVPTLPAEDAFYHDRERPETLKQLNRIERVPELRQFSEKGRWKELAETLIGEPAIGHSPEWFNKPPSVEHPTPPHQDNYYFNLEPPHVVTIWMALDHVDEENGCLRYVAGSHLKGIRPHGRTAVLGFSQGISDYSDEDRAQEEVMVLEPGDVIVHHGNTIHRADANRSTTRHRRSFAIVFHGESAVRNEEAFERYLASSKQQQAGFQGSK